MATAPAIVSDGRHAVWIAVGSAGTSLSRDGGTTWHPAPSSSAVPAQAWTSLSLPFVVGPHGAIGRLNEDSVKN